MSSQDFKTQLASLMGQVERDLRQLWADLQVWFMSLDQTERMMVLCVGMIALFYVFLRHFSKGESADDGSSKFAGILLVVVALSAGTGWLLSGRLELG